MTNDIVEKGEVVLVAVADIVVVVVAAAVILLYCPWYCYCYY